MMNMGLPSFTESVYFNLQSHSVKMSILSSTSKKCLASPAEVLVQCHTANTAKRRRRIGLLL